MAQTKNKKSTNKNTAKSSQSKSKSTAKTAAKTQPRPIRREVAAVVSASAALLTAISIFSSDGIVVGAISAVLKGLLGYGFWVCAPVFVLVAVIQGFHRGRPVVYRTTSALLIPLLLGALLDLLFSSIIVENLEGVGAVFGALYAGGKAMNCGGVLGGLLAFAFQKAFSFYGAAIILAVAFAFFTLSAFGITIGKLIEWITSREHVEYEPEPEPEKPAKKQPVQDEDELRRIRNAKRRAIDIPLDDEPLFEKKTEPAEKKNEKADLFGKKSKKPTTEAKTNHTADVEPISIEEAEALTGVKLTGSGTTEAAEIADPPRKMSAAEIAAETAAVANEIESKDNDGKYEKPPIYLLKKGHSNTASVDEELDMNRERLENAIKSFGVNASVVDTTHGPTVTRYDFELEQGVKLSRLTNLANDIALALGVVSVRIAPIPDKISTVGIEVPNKIISTVYLRDIIDSPKFTSSKADLTFAIGKDIGGNSVVGNISKLPHLLIAGTTGSGKSVCMNSLIISILYKSDPEDVKLIMIDPKMVELGVYNGIPHLYIPVVTDPKKAAGALQWAVTEMLKRYRLFSELGVRSLTAYNEHLVENGQPKMPNVVVVIDELADLMLVASKEVEESICRVAQMGRAAGMHLVIATQRPSADVITGLMKANIPSRIAFAVSSALESRIILDNAGAEKLIGMGDMLYAPIGCGKPLRVQGAFVSDEERDAIVSFIKEQATADYSEDIIAQIEKAAEDKSSGSKGGDSAPVSDGKPEYDELLPQAVDVIFDTKQASVSMLQRRLKLGYSRAARIIDQMEEMGIIGPFEGSKPRQIVITREQWLEMQTTQGTAPTEMLQTQLEFADEINSED